MRFTDLTLTNFCQHKKRTVNFRYGITGITGRNGSGKSNLADPGFYFAVSGKTPAGINKS